MNIKETTSDFIKQSKRVLKVARKPDREEYFNFSKVTAIFIRPIIRIIILDFYFIIISKISKISIFL